MQKSAKISDTKNAWKLNFTSNDFYILHLPCNGLINENPATRGTFIRMNDEREYDEKSH